MHEVVAPADAIAEARAAAQQMEWERHAREKRVFATLLRHTIEGIEEQIAVMQGVLEHLEAGDWIQSPEAMAAARAAAGPPTDGQTETRDACSSRT